MGRECLESSGAFGQREAWQEEGETSRCTWRTEGLGKAWPWENKTLKSCLKMNHRRQADLFSLMQMQSSSRLSARDRKCTVMENSGVKLNRSVWRRRPFWSVCQMEAVIKQSFGHHNNTWKMLGISVMWKCLWTVALGAESCTWALRRSSPARCSSVPGVV